MPILTAVRGATVGNRELQVSQAELRRAAEVLGQAVDRLDADLTALEGELSGFGRPWGGDEIGMLIGACYQGAYDLAMECFDSNLEDLDTFVEDLERMADNYQESEDLTDIEVNRIKEILG